MGKVVIICPIFNEKENIIDFLYSISNYINDDVHLLLLDDFSTDGSRELLQKISQYNFLNVYFIFNDYNLGYGENLLRGFLWALEKGYEIILTIDADFQHLPSYIPIFINLAEKYEFITGSRYSFSSLKIDEKNFFRYLINKKMVEFVKSFFNVRITDFFCGFRAYRRDLLSYICKNLLALKERRGLHFSYDFPIYLWIDLLSYGCVVKEFPIPFIFFTHRKFKGRSPFSKSEGRSPFSKSEGRSPFSEREEQVNINNHYKRIKLYVDIFCWYYWERMGKKSLIAKDCWLRR